MWKTVDLIFLVNLGGGYCPDPSKVWLSSVVLHPPVSQHRTSLFSGPSPPPPRVHQHGRHVSLSKMQSLAQSPLTTQLTPEQEKRGAGTLMRRESMGSVQASCSPEELPCSLLSVCPGHRGAQSFCFYSRLAEVLWEGGHCSFPSWPVKSHQSQQAPARPVFTICCSLRTIEKIKERKNYCSKCDIFWKLYQVDVNASKSMASQHLHWFHTQTAPSF